MYNHNYRLRGQNLAELALGLAVIAAAILTMQLFIQRGLQGRYKGGPDYLMQNITAEAQAKGVTLKSDKAQYEPYYRESVMTEVRGKDKPDIIEKTKDGVMHVDTTASRSGWSTTLPADKAD